MSPTEELCNDLMKNVEKKGQLAKSYGLWIQKREEGRRAHDAHLAEDAAREVENELKRDIEKLVAFQEAG